MLTVSAAGLLLSAWTTFAAGKVVGHHDLGEYGGSEYRVKEVVRFLIDRPSKVVGLKAAFAGASGEATLHIWQDIDHAWPFYHFERDAIAPISIAVSSKKLKQWQEIPLKSPAIVRNTGYVYVGIVYRRNSPQLAIDDRLDQPDNSRYEIIDLKNQHTKEVYWPKPKGDYAVAISLEPLPKKPPIFEDVTKLLTPRPEVGPAVAWADVDGNGWEDLLAGNKLLTNVAGKRFFDNTKGFGINEEFDFGIFADIDNDDDPDLFLGGKRDRLLLNNRGHFTESKNSLEDGWKSRCASWLDFDNDGRIDLFVANGEDGVPTRNRLWRNVGGGKFVLADILQINGKDVSPAFSFTSTAADLDLNGRTELAVLGFRQQPDQLWWFQKNKADNRAAKFGFDVGKTPSGAISGGMGTGAGIGDLNDDAIPDMWISNLVHPDWRGHEGSLPSLLYLSSKHAGYQRLIAESKGIMFDESPSDPTLGDFDNDGDLDVYSSSKYHHGDYYENIGGVFQDATYRSNIRTYRGESAAVCDYDRDGRLDIAVQSEDGLKLYRNVTPRRSWISVQLRGHAIGASVIVKANGKRYLRQVISGKGLGSQDSRLLHFGLGDAKKVDSIDITWPGGHRQRIGRVRVNQKLVISRNSH